MLARRLAFERPVVPGEPTARQGRDLERLAVAELDEAIERLVVVGIGRKQQRRPLRTGRGLLEQPQIMPLHLAEMAEQHFGENIAAGKPDKARKSLQTLRLLGQRL